MITSTRNQHVLFCKSLHHSRSRRDAGTFLIEGYRLAAEALKAEIPLDLVLYDEAAITSSGAGREVFEQITRLPCAYAASPDVIAAAADTRTPQGVVMVAKQPTMPALAEVSRLGMILILDGISDPGNVGTILRSSAAAGVKDVAFAGNGVDPYAPKVVRAAMGAHFRLRLFEATWEDLTKVLEGFQVVGAAANSELTIYDIDWRQRTAVVLGSEAHGISPEAEEVVTLTARIPMSMDVESLNVGAVASIILFHARREGATSGVLASGNPGTLGSGL